MEYLSVLTKPSSMLTPKIMSFDGDYLKFRCHKEMSIKTYIHQKMTFFPNRVYFVFVKASTVQSEKQYRFIVIIYGER